MNPKPDQNHGRPAEQRERTHHGEVPADPDAARRAERAAPYRGDEVGGFTPDRGRNPELKK